MNFDMLSSGLAIQVHFNDERTNILCIMVVFLGMQFIHYREKKIAEKEIERLPR